MNLSAFHRKPEIRLTFPQTQDWRISHRLQKSPVFLASQEIAGIVEIRSRKSPSEDSHNRLQIVLTGL